MQTYKVHNYFSSDMTVMTVMTIIVVTMLMMVCGSGTPASQNLERTFVSTQITIDSEHGRTSNISVNSLTTIKVPAGTKNSRPVGFLR